MKKPILETQVIALNLLNEHASKIADYEKDHFSKFVGKDVVKVDGSIKTKYDHEKLDIQGTLEDGTQYRTQYWFNTMHSFDVVVKICVYGGSYDLTPSTAFCQYYEIRTELFRYEDGKLTESTRQKDDFDKRYNVDSLLKLKKEAEEAAEQYRQISRKIPSQFRDTLGIDILR